MRVPLMVIDFISYAEARKAEEAEERAADVSAEASAKAEAARRAEVTKRVNLEWVLADLLADIQAA